MHTRNVLATKMNHLFRQRVLAIIAFGREFVVLGKSSSPPSTKASNSTFVPAAATVTPWASATGGELVLDMMAGFLFSNI